MVLSLVLSFLRSFIPSCVGWLVGWLVGRSVDLLPWHSYDRPVCDIICTWEGKHYKKLSSTHEDRNINNLRNIWFMYYIIRQ
jgi:hypothetical protein